MRARTRPARQHAVAFSSEIRLQRRDCREQQDAEERQQHSDRRGKQDVVESAAAVGDELAPLRLTKVGGKGAHTRCDAGPVLAAGADDRGKARYGGYPQFCREVVEARLEWLRAQDVRRNEQTAELVGQLAVDLER